MSSNRVHRTEQIPDRHSRRREMQRPGAPPSAVGEVVEERQHREHSASSARQPERGRARTAKRPPSRPEWRCRLCAAPGARAASARSVGRARSDREARQQQAQHREVRARKQGSRVSAGMARILAARPAAFPQVPLRGRPDSLLEREGRGPAELARGSRESSTSSDASACAAAARARAAGRETETAAPASRARAPSARHSSGVDTGGPSDTR